LARPDLLSRIAVSLGCVLFCAGGSRAQEGLKAIDNPGGGKILYGQVAGQSTAAGAMGAVLRSIHAECGAAPGPAGFFA
jgi:hypothetical protein